MDHQRRPLPPQPPTEDRRAGFRWERAHRLPEAVECYLVGGGFADAARVLSHVGWFYEAGLSLLMYLPPGSTPVRGISPERKKLCLDAAVCFARAGARWEAVGLLAAFGEHVKAANLLIRAGLRQEAVGAMRGDHIAGSPWPEGVVGPLVTLPDLIRRIQDLARSGNPDYQPVVHAPQGPAVDDWHAKVAERRSQVVAERVPSGSHVVSGPSPLAPFQSRIKQAVLGSASTLDETQAEDLSRLSDPHLSAHRRNTPPIADRTRDAIGGREGAAQDADSFVQAGSLIRDRYRIEGRIGAGGMATVYKAMDEELQEVVALKMFRVVVDDPVRLKRFRREMKINRRLRHPNIVLTYEYGTWRGARFITMELLDGVELADFLKDTQADTGQRIRLMMQVCDGLGSAHEQGIVHRDVKPSNLFVVEDGRKMKVMDFGIAKAVDSSTISVTGVRVGTPRYMSPEQIQGNQTVGPAADLYSLGAVMYEVFTGSPVFQDQDLMPLLLNHLSEEPEPPSKRKPGLLPELDEICLRLLAKNPRERFVDCNAVKSALLRAYVKAERRR